MISTNNDKETFEIVIKRNIDFGKSLGKDISTFKVLKQLHDADMQKKDEEIEQISFKYKSYIIVTEKQISELQAENEKLKKDINSIIEEMSEILKRK